MATSRRPRLDRGRPPGPGAAARFYTRAARLGGRHARRAARLHARAAATSPASSRRRATPAWRTHVWVDSVDEVASARRRRRQRDQRAATSPASAAGHLADPAGAVFSVSSPSAHRGAQVVNEPGAWAMSALATPDLEGANAFYNAVFGWETDSFAAGDMEFTMWRLPGFVGGEPEQPVPRDLVAVGLPGDAPCGASTSGSTTSTPPPGEPTSSAAPCSTPRRTGPSAAAPSSPTRRARRSRQPRGAGMSTIEVVNHVTLDGVMQAPAHPDEDRRGGFEHGGWATRVLRRRPGRVHGRAHGPRRRRAAVRPLDLREDGRRLAEQPEDNPVRQVLSAAPSTSSRAPTAPRRVGELRAAHRRRGRDRRRAQGARRTATS